MLFVSGKRLLISVRCRAFVPRIIVVTHVLIDPVARLRNLEDYVAATAPSPSKPDKPAVAARRLAPRKVCLSARAAQACVAVANRTFELRSWRLRAQSLVYLKHLRLFRINWSSSIGTMSCFLQPSF
jgi:hypothetical protein